MFGIAYVSRREMMLPNVNYVIIHATLAGDHTIGKQCLRSLRYLWPTSCRGRELRLNRLLTLAFRIGGQNPAITHLFKPVFLF